MTIEVKGQLITKKTYDPNQTRLSVSKLKTFEQCKAKFRFSYIEKLPKKEWDFHVFGKFLHEVLEHFHDRIIKGNDLPDHILMKSCFDSSLKNWSEKITSEQKKECFQILSSYLKKKAAEDAIGNVVTDVELEFNVNVEDTILINGFIDVIRKDGDGVLHVADYKTSKDPKYLKKDPFQLKTYAYVMCLKDPSLEKIRCSYIMLRHNFMPIVFEFTRNDVMVVEEYYLKKAAEMRKEKLYRPSPSPLCGYCDFVDHCEAGQRKLGIVKQSFGQTDW